MNQKEAAELLPIIKAFSEGKVIQVKQTSGEWISFSHISFDGDPKYYRIKPELKYRPFKDAEECWNEMQKHQPLGWLNDKKDRSHSLITYIETNEEGVFINGIGNYSFNEIMEKFTFADGTPFGILVEE